MPFCPNSSEFPKNNARNIKHMAALVFPKFLDFEQNAYSRTSSQGNCILHKYPYSALVVATEYYSMFCRHRFRKRLVGQPNDKTVENFQNAAKYIAQHKEITNVIISGGDPMMLATKVIAKMLEALKDIDHVNYVCFSTRTPVVSPLHYFDDEGLIEVLRDFNLHKTLYIPTHFNHAKEITDLSQKALMRIRNAGITVTIK